MRFLNRGLVLIISSLILFPSCFKKPAIEQTTTYTMAGEWFTRYYYNGSPITPVHKIISYNVADPAAMEVWVDDLGTWPFKSKFTVDLATLSFTPMASTPNTKITGKTIKVIEGKVIPKAGHSKSGNLVDSIYLKLEFSDDPGETYEIKGHFRTGFAEDDY
jgi:hypothetical protein